MGKSDAMQQVFKMIGRVSGSEAPVMITGESGSGKELVAKAIHAYSARSNKSFLAINCAAIPENLLESELFGHEKGSFTGAHTQRIGRFEQSNGGTLFLDEIGEMPLQVQSKILRVLQGGEFSRVGGNQTLRTDVRVVCATNRNLEEEVARKRFREDLFYRLNVVRIHLLPLRARIVDVRLLAEYFLQKIAQHKHRPPLTLSEDAIKVLESYPWPGNVRELENTMQRASVLAMADVLLPKDIPLGQVQIGEEPQVEIAAPSAAAAGEPAWTPPSKPFSPPPPRIPDTPLLPWLEREFTLRAMQRTGGNQVRAAKLLGITRATLRKRPRAKRFAQLRARGRIAMPSAWMFDGGTFRESASVSPFDRGFRYGMSVFETFGIHRGKILFFGQHTDRLTSSARAARIPLPDGLLEAIAGVPLPEENSVLRVYATAGPGAPCDPVRMPSVYAILESADFPTPGRSKQWCARGDLSPTPFSPSPAAKDRQLLAPRRGALLGPRRGVRRIPRHVLFRPHHQRIDGECLLRSRWCALHPAGRRGQPRRRRPRLGEGRDRRHRIFLHHRRHRPGRGVLHHQQPHRRPSRSRDFRTPAPLDGRGRRLAAQYREKILQG